MTIDPEMLAAYADGELGPDETAKVEAAVAQNPALAEQIEAQRKLRQTLSAHFAPILDMSVPDKLTDPLAPKDNVVALAAARAAKQEEAPRRRSFVPRWAVGGAIAASLAIGVVIGGQMSGGGSIRSVDGRLVASGTLDRALTNQLTSAQEGTDARILISFQTSDGHYCRAFESGATAGIACREAGRWAIRQSQTSAAQGPSGGYRQAGSASAGIMAAAQDMAASPALDAAAERTAREKGWH